MNGPFFKTLPIFAAMALITTCWPHAEQEEIKWAKNVEDLKTCMAAFPAFKPILTQTLADAETLRDQVKKTRDSEKKAELMAKANKKIQTDVLKGLGTAIRLSESFDNRQKTLWQLQIPVNRRDSVKQVRLSAVKKYKDAKKILAAADGSTTDSAMKAINEANAELKEADGSLDRMIKSIEGAKKRKNK